MMRVGARPVTEVEKRAHAPPGVAADDYPLLLCTPTSDRLRCGPASMSTSPMAGGDTFKLRLFDRGPDSEEGRALVGEVRGSSPPVSQALTAGFRPARCF